MPIADDYKTALERSKKAEYTSDLDLTAEDAPRTKKKRTVNAAPEASSFAPTVNLFSAGPVEPVALDPGLGVQEVEFLNTNQLVSLDEFRGKDFLSSRFKLEVVINCRILILRVLRLKYFETKKL